MQDKPYAQRGRTVMRITNAHLLGSLDSVRAEIREALGCRRNPGIQVVLDCLMQFWLRSRKEKRQTHLANWETDLMGYPNSRELNPGQFAPLKDVEAVNSARGGPEHGMDMARKAREERRMSQ